MKGDLEAHDAIERTTCCIVGGGPAGMMLGLLLARAGVEVTVLEKHADFLRDFRGDTVHPSTLELIDELGFMGELERLPHRAVSKLMADVDGTKLTVADLGDLPGRHGHIYMLPQWDFLELLTRKAAEHRSFSLRMSAEVIAPWRERGRVAGVVYRSEGVLHRLRADLVVACDGRGSRLRSALGAKPVDLGAPMDVLWLRIPRKRTDPQAASLSIRRGRLLVLIDRDDYWQAGYVIPKGDSDRVRREGIARLVESLEQTAPLLGDRRLRTMTSFDGIGMLSVQVNQLPCWFGSGVLFIGDAAHAMSPVAGVGINLAIQDAVAAARILAEPLRRRRVSTIDLARVQARRCVPALLTQIMQVAVQRWLIGRVLAGVPIRVPRYLPKLLALRPVRALLARAVGRGVRPEHWRPRVPRKTARLAAIP